MKPSFIRIAEIWLPNQDHTLLEFGGGLFGEAKDFADATTKSLRFGIGEGLPGQAWEKGHPILLKSFDDLHFRRTAAAKSAGLSCAIAIPVFVGGVLKAVAVLFGGSEDTRAGAIELWHNNARVTSDMTLVDGYYGTASDSFENLSKDTFLPRGTGLPGLAWQRGTAVFMENLGESRRFLRGDTAAEAGITRGLGLPCSAQTDDAYVMTLLSAMGTPIVQHLESWSPDASRQQLLRTFGFSETEGLLTAPSEAIALDADNPIAKIFRTGVPAISEATSGSVAAMIAMPVVSEGEVTEVLVLTL